MNYPYKTTKIINKRRFPTYQLHARTINESLPPEKVMCICILETFAWLRGRLSQYENIPNELCLPEPDDYDKFDMGTLKSFQLNLGFSLDIVYSEKDKLWAFCLSEDDMGANLGTPTERKPVVGRNFETNIAFRVIDRYVEVGFRTVCSEPSDTTAVCEVFRPSVVKALFRNKNVGLRHIINITDSPINITSTKDVQRIKEAVFDRQRELPIVVVTQPAPVEEKPRMPKIELPTGMGVLFKTAGNVKDYSTNLIIDREKLGLKVNVPVKPEKANVASQISESQEKAIVQTHIPDTVDVDKIAYSAASFAFVCKVDDGLARQNKRSFINPLKIGYSEYPIFSLKTETYLNALFIGKENLVNHQHIKLIFFFYGKLVPSVQRLDQRLCVHLFDFAFHKHKALFILCFVAVEYLYPVLYVPEKHLIGISQLLHQLCGFAVNFEYFCLEPVFFG